MREIPARQSNTTLLSSAGTDSKKRQDPTQHLGTLAEQTRVERPDTTHAFFESTWFDGLPPSLPRKLIVCHELFPLSFSRI